MNRRGHDRLACPHCGACGFWVVISRPNAERTLIYRRLECRGCERRFSTEERILTTPRRGPHPDHYL